MAFLSSGESRISGEVSILIGLEGIRDPTTLHTMEHGNVQTSKDGLSKIYNTQGEVDFRGVVSDKQQPTGMVVLEAALWRGGEVQRLGTTKQRRERPRAWTWGAGER